MTSLDSKRAVVVGASRGLGRGIAASLAGAGASVLALARTKGALRELASAHPSIDVLAGDATDPNLAAMVIAERSPEVLVVVAGASPPLRPIHQHTWETFSLNWNIDTRMAFNWLREAMLAPLRPGSRVVLMSSGAAQRGSPMSGGYAGAKAMINFMAGYADEESRRADLGIRVFAILPQLTPSTALGQAAARAYAARAAISYEEYRARIGTPLTPEDAGRAVVELAAGDRDGAVPYALSGEAGLAPLAS